MKEPTEDDVTRVSRETLEKFLNDILAAALRLREERGRIDYLEHAYIDVQRLVARFHKVYMFTGESKEYTDAKLAREFFFGLAVHSLRVLDDLGLMAPCTHSKHTFDLVEGTEPYEGQPCACGRRIWQKGEAVVPLKSHQRRCTVCLGTGEVPTRMCACAAALGTNWQHSRKCPAFCSNCFGRGHV